MRRFACLLLTLAALAAVHGQRPIEVVYRLDGSEELAAMNPRHARAPKAIEPGTLYIAGAFAVEASCLDGKCAVLIQAPFVGRMVDIWGVPQDRLVKAVRRGWRTIR